MAASPRAMLGSPDGSAPRARVPLGELEEARIKVKIAPLSTLGMLTFDAVQQTSQLGTPSHLVRSIRSHLRPRDVEVLGPFTGRGTPPPSLIGQRIATPIGLARILCGDPGLGVTNLPDELEAITATDPDAFLESVETCATESTSESWSALFSNPSQWLCDYATAMNRAWLAVEPLWRQSIDLLEREAERVEVAVARGASIDLVTALHPRTTIAGGSWRLPTDERAIEYRLASTFTVSPMITDPIATTVFSDGAATLPVLFYPAPRAWRGLDGEPPPPASLEALLGWQRARILRSLDEPRRAGQIAQALHTVPGGATYHLRQLELAGLLSRERRGRDVIVARTPRGTALLALYNEN